MSESISARFLTALCLASVVLTGQTAAQAADFERFTGHLSILWGDPAPGTGGHPQQVIRLTEDGGRTVELEVSAELRRAHGGAVHWNGARVEVTVEVQRTDSMPGLRLGAQGPEPLKARAFRFLEKGGKAGEAKMSVTGSQPWISILCKFQDVGDEPENVSFFQNMYGSQPGGLDHYWRELSYDRINVAGSTAVDWVVLPHPQSYYAPTPGSGSAADKDALFDDCTAAADPFVDFSNGGEPFVGINMMFNGVLDCCAWGGGRWATLDGETGLWRVTWEPPWAYRDAGVIGHEMGHGFGLPHSTNWDNDGFPYDTPWDVMSSATVNSVFDSTYGRLGKHTVAYHKADLLGWITAGEIFDVPGTGVFVVSLDHMARATADNYRIARVPIDGSSRFYTVEARKRLGSYEGNLPGDAVIICEVDPAREEPAWTVDGAQPPANFANNEGTMWKVGEVFTDSVNQIAIAVVAETVDGFVVEISKGNESLFSDGFESGDLSRW